MYINSKNTDRAANMQRKYNGFSVKLNEVASKKIHVWCYTYVLNLVINDITCKIVRSITLFEILNGCAVFIGESHIRIEV